MTGPAHLRTAASADEADLLRLWALVFDELVTAPPSLWQANAREWLERHLDAGDTVRFSVIEIGGKIVATAIGTLELGVPNPQCLRGRTVRIANVITSPEYRRQGHGATLVLDLVTWARAIGADRVDLSSTADGRRLYERLDFVMTSAPRLKLIL